MQCNINSKKRRRGNWIGRGKLGRRMLRAYKGNQGNGDYSMR